jgi:hypothetical protein
VTFTSRCGRIRMTWACLALLAPALWISGAWRSYAEFTAYPQFRYVSGLPGNGYAVDADGLVGWDGAMSQCIPLGYTPSHGSAALPYSSGGRDGGLQLGFGGNDVNGTLAPMVGFGPRGHGVAVVADFVDNHFNVAMHLQGQVLKETKSQPAVSVGVLDWANRREATFTEYAERGARSLYVAATKRFEAGGRPLHVTVGFGTHRFNERPLVGACYDVHDRVKVLAEYDGLSLNAAAAAQLLPGEKGGGVYAEDRPGRPDALILFLGVADMEKPVVGLTYTRKGLF